MQIQIVTFELRDLDDAAYQALCDDLAPAFAAVPGLIQKTWLADSAANTYGGVYAFKSKEALEAYKASDLFASVGAHPNFKNIQVGEFSVLDAPTRVTTRANAATAPPA